MITDWLEENCSTSIASNFEIFFVEETERPEKLKEELAQRYLEANVSLSYLEDCKEYLLETTDDLDLEKLHSSLKKVAREAILPSKSRKSTRSGLFGEFLTTTFFTDKHNFTEYVQKLRFREKSNWAPKNIDICVVRHTEPPDVLFLEVKSRSYSSSDELLVKAVDSLKKGLNDKYEFLHWIGRRLRDQGRFKESDLFKELAFKENYNQINSISIINECDFWDNDKVLLLDEYLEEDNIGSIDVRVFLVENYRKMVGEVHSLAVDYAANT